MKNNIQKSIDFLIQEFERLKKKQKEKNISSEEKETLKKLSLFLGRNLNEKNN